MGARTDSHDLQRLITYLETRRREVDARRAGDATVLLTTLRARLHALLPIVQRLYGDLQAATGKRAPERHERP